MNIKSFFSKLLANGLVIVTVSLGVGILSMLALLKVYDAVWGEGPTRSVAVNEVAVAEQGNPEDIEIRTHNLRGLQVPFVNKTDGTLLGFVKVDIAIEVAGETEFEALENDLGELKLSFSERLRTEGAGRADQPGLVDFDRLARTFLTLATEERGLRGIQEVTVKMSDEG